MGCCDGGEHKGTLTGHTDSVYSVTFSPDGRTLASGGGWPAGTVHLWDSVTGEHKGALAEHAVGFYGPDAAVYSVAFSPDAGTLASGGADGTIRLWDAVTGEHKGTLTGHVNEIYDIALSPAGRMLASGNVDGTVRLWDVVTGEHKQILAGHWSYTDEHILQILNGHSSEIYSVAFSPAGNTLASGGADGTVILWDVVTGAYKQALSEHWSVIYSVAFSPDGNTLASGSADSTVILWDVVAGTHKQPLTGHTGQVASVAFSPDGRTVASGSYDNTIRLWDAVTGMYTQTLTGHTSRVYSVTFSPDGNTLASGSSDDTIRLWDVVTGTHKGTLTGHTSLIRCIAFSPDGNTLASGSADGTIRLWDTVTGANQRTFTGYTRWVRGIAFSPDGTTLVSGNEDGTVLLWEITPTMEPPLLLGDVNRDGVVNAQDLVLVAAQFGRREENNADINGDGIVNILDLVTVASTLGNAAAAPSVTPHTRAILTADKVESWLTQAQQMALTDPAHLRGIAVLEQLLAALTPKETVLLPNYPNPFNPETWIPYHLAHNTDVQITIYDTRGAVVRQLDLGHQSAGYYTDRAKAAYWDGCNESGESVASGVYFYQLQAGDYSITRRMVILK